MIKLWFANVLKLGSRLGYFISTAIWPDVPLAFGLSYFYRKMAFFEFRDQFWTDQNSEHFYNIQKIRSCVGICCAITNTPQSKMQSRNRRKRNPKEGGKEMEKGKKDWRKKEGPRIKTFPSIHFAIPFPLFCSLVCCQSYPQWLGPLHKLAYRSLPRGRVFKDKWLKSVDAETARGSEKIFGFLFLMCANDSARWAALIGEFSDRSAN